MIDNGFNPMLMKRGIELAVDEAVEAIKGFRKKLHTKKKKRLGRTGKAWR